MYSEIEKPILSLSYEIKELSTFHDDKIANIIFENRRSGEEIICKVQSFDDLYKIKSEFNNLIKTKERFNGSVGDKCHLFLENGEVKIKTLKERFNTKEFNTSLGLIACQDNGEWGGGLKLSDRDGKKHCNSGGFSFQHVFEYDNHVYILSSIAHMWNRDCGFHEIRKTNEGYELFTFFESHNMYFSAFFVDEHFLYFYSNSHYNGLCRLDLDTLKLDIIHSNLCPSIDVSSLVIKDNFIYIYGNYVIVKYDLNSRKVHSLYTNLTKDEISKDDLIILEN